MLGFGRSKILSALLRVTIVSLAGVGLAQWLLRPASGSGLLLLGGLLVFEALVGYINMQRGPELAARVFLWGHWLVLNALYVVSDSFRSTAAVFQLLLVVAAGLIGTGRNLLWLALGSIAVNVGWYTLSIQGGVPLILFETNPKISFVTQAISLLATVGLISIFSNTFNNYMRRIREDELTYRALFERTSDAVFLIDLNFRFLDINNRAVELLGYEKKDLIGSPLLSIIVAEERDEALERFHQVKHTGSLLPARQTLIGADGQARIVELNLALVRDASGQPRHYQSTGRDVTDIARENLRLKSSLADLSVQASTDPLTGILNRRVILEHAKAEWDRHRRENNPMSVMMVDMNRLKTINDRFGHAAGDAALRRLADVLRANKRQYDWLGRYGGDEFLMVLPGADDKTAKNIAERITRSLSAERIMTGGQPQPLDASVGVSSTNANSSRAMSVEQLIDFADQALYESKRATKAN